MRITKKGQTLVEVVMSIGVSVIVIVALVVLATSSLRNAQESLRKSERSKFASAGIEAVIYFKNVTGFSSIPTGNYYLVGSSVGTVLAPIVSPSTPWVNITSPSGLTYQRNIAVVNNTGTMDITSTVKWADTQGSKQTQVRRLVTDWR